MVTINVPDTTNHSTFLLMSDSLSLISYLFISTKLIKKTIEKIGLNRKPNHTNASTTTLIPLPVTFNVLFNIQLFY